jgi:predicted dehydrogenase
MRRNGERAADYARRHGIARWHDDAEAIIAAPDIDAVYIATLTDESGARTARAMENILASFRAGAAR